MAESGYYYTYVVFFFLAFADAADLSTIIAIFFSPFELSRHELIRGIHLFRPREKPPWHHGVLQ
jgi:hypothetical protein